MDSGNPAFLSLLLSIGHDLTEEDFENLKFLCRGTVPASRLENISRPRELFLEIIHCCGLSEQNKSPLASLLFHIARHDLRNRLLGIEGGAITRAFNYWGGIPCRVPNFVGRKGQCSAVVEKLDQSDYCRIVSITGPPGFGKSAIAIQVGHELISQGKTNVYYVSLRDLRSLNGLVNSLLGALQIIASKEPIQQAKNYLQRLRKHSVIILDNAEDLLIPPVKDKFCRFIEDLAETALSVKILITSRQSITFFSVDTFSLCLDSLCPDHGRELLMLLDPNVSEDDAKQLACHCGGVPLVLRTTGALLLKGVDAKALISEFEMSPVSTLKSFSLNSLSHEHQLFNCLGICFDRLGADQQVALISLAVFPTTFTACDAQFLFRDHSKYNLQILLQDLVDNSMLQFDFLSKQYYVHSIIQSFCLDRVSQEASLSPTLESARKLFNIHYLMLLKELYALFLGKGCLKATEKFLINRRNIRQALNSSLLDPELEEMCIDTATAVCPLLAKMLRKEKFLSVYGQFTALCKANGDKKRYSDCLTAEAFCILSHCACHLPCPSAVAGFKEADNLQKGLGDDSSTMRAICLSKLGRCHGQSKDLEQAIPLIKRAIEIRENLKDEVFVAVGYKDLGAAYAFNDAHKEANEIRKEKSLPVYLDLLGDHPFTATLMEDMGASYLELGDYDNSIKFIREALRMRKQSLGDHQETARSYHDLGMALAVQGYFTEALGVLRSALAIQDKVLGNHQETTRTHRQIAHVLKKLGRDKEARTEELMAHQRALSIYEPQPEN
ncbi:uncharacterized protein LOC141889538 [Acropora palmata]|uniref:uncharacterized protein LOC141889538 n=1 Tax=Acropora palmata TaxID=6131 RepID=UPI003DA05281